MSGIRIVGNALAMFLIIGAFVTVPAQLSVMGLVPFQTRALFIAIAIILLVLSNGVQLITLFNENEQKHRD